MKKMTSILGALAVAAALTAGFTACTSDDNIIGDEPITEQPGAVKTYQVSIPATMPSDATTRAVSFDGTTSTSTFASTERVYVYNVTKDEMMGGYLQPSNITTDGKSCNLTGTLSGGTIEAGNELKLLYNLTNVETDKTGNKYKNQTFYNYQEQDGTQAGVLDGAEADVTVSSYTGGVLTTTAKASFLPVQSMFRQRLTFKNASDETVTPTIKKLEIKSKNKRLSKCYYPVENSDFTNDILTILLPTIDANGDIYLAMRFVGSDGTDALTFTAQDNDNNVYECTKNEPSGGFQNGKYYHGSMTLTYTHKADQPTITGSNVTPDNNGLYAINATNDVTISGNSTGYNFRFTWGITVTLDNLTAVYSGTNTFMYANQNLNLVVNGTNSISCPNANYAIFSDNNLKLSGNGTLTVTAKNYKYGIFATSNYSGDGNVSNIAATGHTVTRSDVTNNSDGTRTWTYTVTTTN